MRSAAVAQKQFAMASVSLNVGTSTIDMQPYTLSRGNVPVYTHGFVVQKEGWYRITAVAYINNPVADTRCDVIIVRNGTTLAGWSDYVNTAGGQVQGTASALSWLKKGDRIGTTAVQTDGSVVRVVSCDLSIEEV